MPTTKPHWLYLLTRYPTKTRGGEADRPYHLTAADGSPWTVATNGRTGLYLPGHCYGDIGVAAAPPAVADKLLGYLAPKGEVRWEGPFSALWAFLGPPGTEPCPECHGTAQTSAYVSCMACDGEDIAAIRPGWLCGIPLDRDLVARALEHLPGRNIADVTVYTTDDKSPLWIVSPSWRLVAMPRKPDAESGLDWDAAPRFPEVTP